MESPRFKLNRIMDNIESEIQSEKTIGKIIKLHESGWGFITSPTYQFTRIFFHWTALQQNTLNFTDLRVGMMVKFFTRRYKEQGVRAYKVEVIENDRSEDTPVLDRYDIK